MAIRRPELARRTITGVVPVLLSLALTLASGALTGHAQERTTVVRVLRESRDFRARVRAAMALGASADPSMAGPLVGALSDAQPAVRAAAAAGLGRLGNTDALDPLRRALADSSREVRDAARTAIGAITASAAASRPDAGVGSSARASLVPRGMPSVEMLPPQRDVNWATVRYVVVLGSMQNRSDFPADRLGPLLENEVRRHLVVLRGIATLQDGAPHAEADREIQRRRIPQMRLEGSINRVQRQVRGRELQVRCEVSLMLMDEPGRNIRAALTGAATGMERAGSTRATQEARLAEQALAGAVRSAMSGAARAITGSAGR